MIIIIPDIKPGQSENDTSVFMYTPTSGHAVTEINNGTHNHNQAFLTLYNN